MLTLDYDVLGLRRGERLLDIGCGAGRHSVEAVRRGAGTVALDSSTGDLVAARQAVDEYGGDGVSSPGRFAAVRADARALPFLDGAFDRVVAAEVLEHIIDDAAAAAELARVLRPGGTLAVTVPRWLPERVCWALSDRYHSVPGGHVRVYRRVELEALLRGAGLVVTGRGYAHALHTPYWWLRCALGVDRDRLPSRLYHRLLVWDLMQRPRLTRWAERALNPVLGKSLVLYARRPAAALPAAATTMTEEEDAAA